VRAGGAARSAAMFAFARDKLNQITSEILEHVEVVELEEDEEGWHATGADGQRYEVEEGAESDTDEVGAQFRDGEAGGAGRAMFYDPVDDALEQSYEGGADAVPRLDDQQDAVSQPFD